MIHPVSPERRLLFLREETEQTKALYDGVAQEAPILRDALRNNYCKSLREYSRKLVAETKLLDMTLLASQWKRRHQAPKSATQI